MCGNNDGDEINALLMIMPTVTVAAIISSSSVCIVTKIAIKPSQLDTFPAINETHNNYTIRKKPEFSVSSWIQTKTNSFSDSDIVRQTSSSSSTSTAAATAAANYNQHCFTLNAKLIDNNKQLFYSFSFTLHLNCAHESLFFISHYLVHVEKKRPAERQWNTDRKKSPSS